MKSCSLVVAALGWSAVAAAGYAIMSAQDRPSPVIPRTWDDQEIARHEVPLADPAASPKHVSSDYYYRIPVRPIYKGYPVYAPGREPAGYFDGLKQEEPVIVWGDGQAPRLETEADWVRAGEIVFHAPISIGVNFTVDDIRDPKWLDATKAPVASDGRLPWYQYIVRKKGQVELGNLACAGCHTRVMPDGSVIKGAQATLRCSGESHSGGGPLPPLLRISSSISFSCALG